MEINKIINLTNHCLHLCNNSNFKETIFAYLVDIDAFVTDDVELWKKIFDENEVKCQVKSPNEIKNGERMVFDGTSFANDFEKFENRWKKQKRAICIYNIDKIPSSIIKQLVDAHDKMILSVDKIRMFSDKNLEEEIDNLSPEIVEELIKKELKNIILSLLLSKPMSGTDLVKLLYQKFKVFISPGMLYPTLHELEKNGLLTYEYKLKNKIYSVQEKEQAGLLLKKHVKVNHLLSQFLVND